MRVYSRACVTATAPPKRPPHRCSPRPTRPSIGLALGGGAARGFAHIGVMRTLAAHGIVPDVIVGTSIGAVVGGCYAAGQLDGLEEWARGLTVRSILSYLDISLSGSGLIRGGHLAAQLEKALTDSRIDDLPIRFAAIATEFNTGHEIWLTRGRLADALRASYALPGIFPPVLIGGRWLVDGALVNPVPVSAARALGARLVIAVNLNSDLFGRGTIIASHGSDESDELPADKPKPNGLRGMFGGERSLRRQFFGAARPPRHSDRDGGSLQRHAGPHHARAAGRRSARRPDQPAARRGRLVRFPPRRGSDRDRRRSDRKGDRGGDRGGRRAVAALWRQRRRASSLTPCGCNPASPRTPARSPRRAA